MKQARKLTDLYSSNYLFEILSGKQIKLIHVVSDFFSNQFSWITAEPHFKKTQKNTITLLFNHQLPGQNIIWVRFVSLIFICRSYKHTNITKKFIEIPPCAKKVIFVNEFVILY